MHSPPILALELRLAARLRREAQALPRAATLRTRLLTEAKNRVAEARAIGRGARPGPRQVGA